MKKTIFILITIAFFASCRSVKKDKTVSSEVVKVEDVRKETETAKQESNTKITKKVETNEDSQTETETETIEPVDPTKPSTHTDSQGKTTSLNNAKKTTSKTKHKAQIKKGEVVNIEAQKAAIIEKNKQESKKEIAKIDQEIISVERKAFNPWNLLWILIPAAVIVIIYKNRAKIWWI
jgi:hypothetical protein